MVDRRWCRFSSRRYWGFPPRFADDAVYLARGVLLGKIVRTLVPKVAVPSRIRGNDTRLATAARHSAKGKNIVVNDDERINADAVLSLVAQSADCRCRDLFIGVLGCRGVDVAIAQSLIDGGDILSNKKAGAKPAFFILLKK